MESKRASVPAWQIDAELAKAQTREAALVAVFRTAYGKRWVHVRKPHGFVYANHATCNAICAKLIAFDKAHPDTNMIGGYWLNYGFSHLGPELPDWIVQLPASSYIDLEEARKCASPGSTTKA